MMKSLLSWSRKRLINMRRRVRVGSSKASQEQRSKLFLFKRWVSFQTSLSTSIFASMHQLPASSRIWFKQIRNFTVMPQMRLPTKSTLRMRCIWMLFLKPSTNLSTNTMQLTSHQMMLPMTCSECWELDLEIMLQDVHQRSFLLDLQVQVRPHKLKSYLMPLDWSWSAHRKS